MERAMPTYEYRCKACQSEIEIWFRSYAAAASETPACTACGRKRLKRLLSRGAAVHVDSPLARPGAPPPPQVRTQESPQELAQAMKRAGTGRNLGEDFKEVAARLDKGENPDSIEKSLRKRAGQKRGTH
jgi:putative FmdB family regulatory protein